MSHKPPAYMYHGAWGLLSPYRQNSEVSSQSYPYQISCDIPY